MPRTKGSKNKPKTVTADFATQIAEKQSAKEALTAEIASIAANIDTLKADLKVKKAALKKAEKEVATLEAKKAKADAKVAEEAKKAEAEYPFFFTFLLAVFKIGFVHFIHDAVHILRGQLSAGEKLSKLECEMLGFYFTLFSVGCCSAFNE